MGKDIEFEFGWNVRDYFDKQGVVAPSSIEAPNYGCDRIVVCDRCGTAHGFCRDIGERMLPQSGSKSQRPSSGRGQSNGLPRLSNEMLSRTPKEVRVLSVQAVDGNYGPQVLIKGALEGEKFLWYLSVPTEKRKNPNYDLLTKEYGLEENDWVDKIFYLHLAIDEMTEQYFPRVSFGDQKKKK